MPSIKFILVFCCALIIVGNFAPINRNQRQDDCTVFINQDGLGEPQTLILKDKLDQKFPFYYPDSKGILNFDNGKKIHLSCVGSDNAFNVTGLQNKKDIFVTCSGNNTFEFVNQKFKFDEFVCKKYPYHVARRTGNRCFNENTEIEIGFQLSDNFVRHVLLCFDETNMTTLYTRFNMTNQIMGYQKSFPRPSFIVGDFFKNLNKSINSLYDKGTEQKTFGYILGSADLGTKYIHKNDTYYLARGHLTAKVDFIYGSQQRLTFYYVNAAPQWQIINAGNWNTLEENCRSYATRNSKDLEVLTGTHGVASLPNIAGIDTQLYLSASGNSRAVPVPRFYWKVLYHEKSKQGVAFVTLNNPYQMNKTTDLFCTDVCNKITWLTWRQNDIPLGYSFCCEVDDFRQTVKSLPPFPVEHLLV